MKITNDYAHRLKFAFGLMLCVLLAAVAGMAQETYTIAISSAANVAKLDLGRVQANTATCATQSLPPSCTQAQACVAANVLGGASCTAADAQTAGVRIYPNSLAGREAFIANASVRSKFDDYVRFNSQLGISVFQAFCRSANQTQKDGICTASGQAAGCGVCDSF